MPLFFFDPLFLLFSIPGLLLSLWAQAKVRGAFARYSQVRNTTGMTGAQVAQRILRANGLDGVVRIEPVQGFLSDHYDPRGKVLRLSPDVYNGTSLAAAGIAAHEVGHAVQDQVEYAPLNLRSAIVPGVQIGGWVGPIIFFVGFGLAIAGSAFGTAVAWLGVILFGLTALFALVTLPVEFDASRRAKAQLVSEGIIAPQDMGGINAVLDAAALTYVAAAIQAIMQVAYYAFILMQATQNRD